MWSSVLLQSQTEDTKEVLSQVRSDISAEHSDRPQFFRDSKDLEECLSLFSPVNASFIKFMITFSIHNTTTVQSTSGSAARVSHNPAIRTCPSWPGAQAAKPGAGAEAVAEPVPAAGAPVLQVHQDHFPATMRTHQETV